MKAFPYIIEIESDKEGYRAYAHEEGMDLRDYFASDAMKGMLAHTGVIYGKNADVDDEAGAIRAYKIADAMMKARKND